MKELLILLILTNVLFITVDKTYIKSDTKLTSYMDSNKNSINSAILLVSRHRLKNLLGKLYTSINNGYPFDMKIANVLNLVIKHPNKLLISFIRVLPG